METVATQTRLFPVKGRDVLEPTEDEFQTAIITAARLMKWTRIVHFRPARTKHGWQTPLQGDNGFPDLLMIRGETLLAVELKAGGRKPTPEQVAWLEAFAKVPGCRAAVWTTRTPWGDIMDALRTL
jgi:hypothetical protein